MHCIAVILCPYIVVRASIPKHQQQGELEQLQLFHAASHHFLCNFRVELLQRTNIRDVLRGESHTGSYTAERIGCLSFHSAIREFDNVVSLSHASDIIVDLFYISRKPLGAPKAFPTIGKVIVFVRI